MSATSVVSDDYPTTHAFAGSFQVIHEFAVSTPFLLNGSAHIAGGFATGAAEIAEIVLVEYDAVDCVAFFDEHLTQRSVSWIGAFQIGILQFGGQVVSLADVALVELDVLLYLALRQTV